MAASERLQSLGVNETCSVRGEHTHTQIGIGAGQTHTRVHI